MSLLIGIDKEGNLEENGWREIEVFRNLVERFGEEGMKAVILAWDPYSAISRMNEVDREQKAAKTYLKARAGDFLKSKDYIESRYLYMVLAPDPLIEMRRTLEKKLGEVNEQIQKLPFNETNAGKIDSYIKTSKTIQAQFDEVIQMISNRGAIKRNIAESMLSGIEQFYKMAREKQKEDEVFRNKTRIKRAEAKKMAKEKVAAELEKISKSTKK
jgi:hypothetical protein